MMEIGFYFGLLGQTHDKNSAFLADCKSLVVEGKRGAYLVLCVVFFSRILSHICSVYISGTNKIFGFSYSK
jgi:hypothetical protein